MKKSPIKAPARFRELIAKYRLETGFSMLEAVVVVGVLLALAVGGLLAYGSITENAKKAKVKSAAAEVHTAALVANIDGDSSTEPQGVIDNWNNSTDKIRVEILPPTSGGADANGDLCVQATNVASPYITARTGACDNVTEGSNPGFNPNDSDGDGIPNDTDPDIDGDGILNGSDPDNGGIVPSFSNAASVWYKASLTSGNGRNWGGVATSADGKKLVSVKDDGSIYTSTDTGRTWVERTAAAASFKSVASSADGSKILAGSTGDLWLSSDSGATWTDLKSPGNGGSGDWRSVAMSSDGTKLFAADNYYGRRIWSSVDGGATWGYGPGSGTAWSSLAVSGDGQIVLAGDVNRSAYISRDSGATYLPILSLGESLWRTSAVSADGNTLYLGADAGRYVSRDSGVTWTRMPDDPDGATWYTPSISTDGSKWAVAKRTSIDSYVYTSEDAGVTWKKQLEPSNGPFTKTALSADNSTLFASTGDIYGGLWIGSFGHLPEAPSVTTPDAFNTVAWKQTYGVTGNFQSVASSADGRKLVSGGTNDINFSYIYTSMDYGETWTTRQTSGKGKWNRFASSANGEKLAATQDGGFIFTSNDSGVTWTKQDSSGSGPWRGISSSYDGTKLVAVRGLGGGIYTSTDSGVTWTIQPGAVTGSWKSVASSADGTRLVAIQSSGGTGLIYTSADSGVTWTPRTGATPGNWTSVATSADGTKLIASQNTGGTWISKDSGATWVRSSGPYGYVSAVASSADGSKLVAAVDGYRVYTSKDGGDNWTVENDPSSSSSSSWGIITTSADGSRLFAMTYGGSYIWRGQY